MDGAASVIAVVSLAVQIIQSVETVKTFIRDIKGASKELKRLVELLDRLDALLQDVREIMERQTSLQHFPLPSNTIFACLESCEASLRVLEDVVKEYSRGQSDKSFSMSRLKDDIKFGCKAKDIAVFEARIQREINELHTALGVNTTSIETTIFPVMLGNQYDMIRNQEAILAATNLILAKQQKTQSVITTRVAVRHEMSMSAPTGTVDRTTQQQWIRSRLSWLGIRFRRTVTYVSVPGQRSNRLDNTVGNIIDDRYETFFRWQFCGGGFYISRQYPYGSILPALRVYPIIEHWDRYWDMLQESSAVEWQQAFETGEMHPFARTLDGTTLLHKAVFTRRSDICRLLSAYGVQVELDIHGLSPLREFGITSSWNTSREVSGLPIDHAGTFRALLEFDQIDELNPDHVQSLVQISFFHSAELTNWLWSNAASTFYGTDLIALRVHIIKALVSESDSLFDPWCDCWRERAFRILVASLDEEMKEQYLAGAFTLLPLLIGVTCSFDSWRSGQVFLEVLAKLDLDAKVCIDMELRNEPYLLTDRGLSRRIRFEEHNGAIEDLRWEWAYDPFAPGYQVITEFNGLSGDAWGPSINQYLWPFFDRRTATKTRKKRARTGQKRPRSRMPGAWT